MWTHRQVLFLNSSILRWILEAAHCDACCQLVSVNLHGFPFPQRAPLNLNMRVPCNWPLRMCKCPTMSDHLDWPSMRTHHLRNMRETPGQSMHFSWPNGSEIPALISLESLYQRSAGVGTPFTLHSNETVPCSVSSARRSSMNSGALYAFGTSTLRTAMHELRPLAFSAMHIQRPPSSRLNGVISTQWKLPSFTNRIRLFSQMRRSFRYHVNCAGMNFWQWKREQNGGRVFNVRTLVAVELLISTSNRVRVPTLTDRSVKRRRNSGGSSPLDRSSTTTSMSFREIFPCCVLANRV